MREAAAALTGHTLSLQLCLNKSDSGLLQEMMTHENHPKPATAKRYHYSKSAP